MEDNQTVNFDVGGAVVAVYYDTHGRQRIGSHEFRSGARSYLLPKMNSSVEFFISLQKILVKNDYSYRFER